MGGGWLAWQQKMAMIIISIHRNSQSSYSSGAIHYKETAAATPLLYFTYRAHTFEIPSQSHLERALGWSLCWPHWTRPAFYPQGTTMDYTIRSTTPRNIVSHPKSDERYDDKKASWGCCGRLLHSPLDSVDTTIFMFLFVICGDICIVWRSAYNVISVITRILNPRQCELIGDHKWSQIRHQTKPNNE